MYVDFHAALVKAINAVDQTASIAAHAILHQSNRILFVGNGGSAAIASHMAVDFSKNGGKPALAFNDASMLTCVSNDYGYENVFAKPIEWFSSPFDALVAISSSGRSENVLRAVERFTYRHSVKSIITLSGFDSDNYLRAMGAVNFWVDSHDYGVVELTHAAILHSLVMP